MQTAQSPASVPAAKRTKRTAGQGDSNPGRAKRNERAEKDKETYPCPFPGCGQSYSRREYLRRHHRKHQDARPFQCPDCSKAFGRSDVLLRHRRRCHPTGSQSPSASPPPVRHLSPAGPSFIPRTSDTRTPGSPDPPSGSNGFFGISQPMPIDPRIAEESASYTPHLLAGLFGSNSRQPVPQHGQGHMEHASALLSMAYGPGGHSAPIVSDGSTSASPASGSESTNGIQRIVPDWQPTTATITSNGEKEDNSGWASLFSGPGWTPLASTALNPFDFSAPSPAAIAPNSPSAFAAAFANLSSYGGNLLSSQSVPTHQLEYDAYAEMLRQHAPQDSREPNPNPERPLVKIGNELVRQRAGAEWTGDRRFHVPAERFSTCYTVEHWHMPSIKTLSYMAKQATTQILTRVPIVHLPTLNMQDLAACLSFAICTIGSVRVGPIGDGSVEPRRGELQHPDPNSEEQKEMESWKSGHTVRQEKTHMLVKSFASAQGVLMTDYNIALLQALLLYHAPYYLSDDHSQRANAYLMMSTLANIARQIGCYMPELEHAQPTLPILSLSSDEALESQWRYWIRLETRRRTAFVVYVLDTLAYLEFGVRPSITQSDIAALPVPASDSLWCAPTKEAWALAVQSYSPMTVDEAMRRVFFLPECGVFDAHHAESGQRYYQLLNQYEFGPFARVIMIVTLIHGVLDIGEGKRDLNSKSQLREAWLTCMIPDKPFEDSEESVLKFFRSGLEKWRQGWDFDPLCAKAGARSPSPAPTPDMFFASKASISPQSSYPTPDSRSGEHVASTGPAFYEEGLPFYWLAMALVNILETGSACARTSEPQVRARGKNKFAGVDYKEMLKSARTFTSMGEGLFQGV